MKFQNNTQKKINLAALFFLLAVTWGVTFNTAGIFTAPVQETLKVPRADLLMTFTYRGIAMVLGSVITGVLLKKFRPLNIMRAGALILFVSYFMMSRINSLNEYFLVNSVQVLATTMTGFVPAAMIISDWYGKNSSTAMGFAFMGSGMGGMFFNILGGRIIASSGWRTSAAVISFIMLGVVLSSLFLLIKEKERQTEVSDINSEEMAVLSDTDPESPVRGGIMLGDAMKKGSFWLLTLSLFLMSIAMNGLINNLAPSLKDIGYPIEFASSVTGICMVGMAVGKLLTGYSMDRFGVKFTCFTGTLLLAAGCLGLIFGHSVIGIALVVISFTLGTPMGSLAVPGYAGKVYGKADFASIQSFFQTAFSIGNIAGPFLISVLYAMSGSYNSSWITLISLTIVSSVIIWLLMPDRKHEMK